MNRKTTWKKPRCLWEGENDDTACFQDAVFVGRHPHEGTPYTVEVGLCYWHRTVWLQKALKEGHAAEVKFVWRPASGSIGQRYA